MENVIVFKNLNLRYILPVGAFKLFYPVLYLFNIYQKLQIKQFFFFSNEVDFSCSI